MLVLRARPAEGETALSFSALGDLLDPVLERTLELLPELQRRALSHALVLEPDDGPATDAHAIGVAVLGALRGLAEPNGVLVAVDDVQWLDEESVAALLYAGRRLREERVALLLTRRAPLGSAFLDELGRSLPAGRYRELEIGPLGVDALHEVVLEHLEVALPAPVLAEVHEASGGNAFYALEIVRTLQRRGVLVEAGQPLPVPESLHELVHGRLLALPAESRELLLAVAAQPNATIELVEAASGVSRAAGLAPALEAGVVELDGERIRFAHPLLAAGTYELAEPAATGRGPRAAGGSGRGSRGAGPAPRRLRHAAEPRRCGRARRGRRAGDAAGRATCGGTPPRAGVRAHPAGRRARRCPAGARCGSGASRGRRHGARSPPARGRARSLPGRERARAGALRARHASGHTTTTCEARRRSSNRPWQSRSRAPSRRRSRARASAARSSGCASGWPSPWSCRRARPRRRASTTSRFYSPRRSRRGRSPRRLSVAPRRCRARRRRSRSRTPVSTGRSCASRASRLAVVRFWHDDLAGASRDYEEMAALAASTGRRELAAVRPGDARADRCALEGGSRARSMRRSWDARSRNRRASARSSPT